MQEQSQFALTLTHYLALGTLIGAIVVTLFALAVSYFSYTNKKNSFFPFVSAYIFPLGFFVALGGTFLTLLYSEVLHYAPCDLCWYQRIFLYPQIFLFGYAWYKKDRNILSYTFLLSMVGLVIALYHHILQMGYDVYKPCSTAPFAVDCSKPSFIEFGFVTFPFMAVVLFGFLSVAVASAIQFGKK